MRFSARKSFTTPFRVLSLNILFVIAVIIYFSLFIKTMSNAQESSLSGIKLIESIKITLENQPNIHLMKKDIELKKVGLQAAKGQFDVTLNASAGHNHDEIPYSTYEAMFYNTPESKTDKTFYEIGASKQFDTGIEIGSTVKMVRTDESISEYDPTNSARVDFFVTVPLLQGRGKESAAVNELAAEKEYEISTLELYDTISQSLLKTIISYWDYVAAQKRLDQLKESEARAQLLVEKIKIFIEAEKRPAADLDQVLANLAEKNAAVLAGIQDLIAAKHSLGLALGLPFEKIELLPLPSDDFPEKGGINIEAMYKKGNELIALSLSKRPDLLALKEKQKYGKILLAAAQNNLLPKVDLTFNLGYSGLEEGSSTSNYIDPYRNNMRGVSVGLLLNYKWPIKNNSSQGLLLQRKCAYEQYIISTNDLERNISSNVLIAINKLKNSLSELEKTHEALISYQSAVENEKKKFDFGISTLFDLISMEEKLTTSFLNEISKQVNVANALASLNFETGNLITSDGKFGSIHIEDLNPSIQ